MTPTIFEMLAGPGVADGFAAYLLMVLAGVWACRESRARLFLRGILSPFIAIWVVLHTLLHHHDIPGAVSQLGLFIVVWILASRYIKYRGRFPTALQFVNLISISYGFLVMTAFQATNAPILLAVLMVAPVALIGFLADLQTARISESSMGSPSSPPRWRALVVAAVLAIAIGAVVTYEMSPHRSLFGDPTLVATMFGGVFAAFFPVADLVFAPYLSTQRSRWTARIPNRGQADGDTGSSR